MSVETVIALASVLGPLLATIPTAIRLRRRKSFPGQKAVGEAGVGGGLLPGGMHHSKGGLAVAAPLRSRVATAGKLHVEVKSHARVTLFVSLCAALVTCAALLVTRSPLAGTKSRSASDYDPPGASINPNCKTDAHGLGDLYSCDVRVYFEGVPPENSLWLFATPESSSQLRANYPVWSNPARSSSSGIFIVHVDSVGNSPLRGDAILFSLYSTTNGSAVHQADLAREGRYAIDVNRGKFLPLASQIAYLRPS
ncbi:hypothetical protein [Streptomyces sp. NPDC046197]|uniref:hypothetical protein n=1 Tax=Streptomyces sp. NPDC046197 TaxID=3154337 RepID=UPI0033FB44B7